MTAPADFIRRQTTLSAPPLVPEIRLHLATEVTPLRRATQATMDESNLPPPYWAFAWPGGQALARYLLDRAGARSPEIVRDGLPFRAIDYAGPRFPGVGDDSPKASDHCPLTVTVPFSALT